MRNNKECVICETSFNPTKSISVPAPNTPDENGVTLLVCSYRRREICSSCWHTIESEVVARQRSLPKNWIVWSENDGQTFAYCPMRIITWELLPTGRPKKMKDVLLPPWLRNPMPITKGWEAGDLVYYQEEDPATARVFEVLSYNGSVLTIKLALKATKPESERRPDTNSLMFAQEAEKINAMVYLARVSAL